jgi:hypothetical protein
MLVPSFGHDKESGAFVFRLETPYDDPKLATVMMELDKSSEDYILQSVVELEGLKLPELNVILVDISRLPKVKVKVNSRDSEHFSHFDDSIKNGIVNCPPDKVVFIYFNITAETATWKLSGLPHKTLYSS